MSRPIFSLGAVAVALVSPGIYRIEGQGSASVLTEDGHLCVEPVTHLLLLPSGAPEGVPGIPREALEAILQDFYGTPEPVDAPPALRVPVGPVRSKMSKKEMQALAAAATVAQQAQAADAVAAGNAVLAAGGSPLDALLAEGAADRAAAPGLTLDKVVRADALISEAQAAAAVVPAAGSVEGASVAAVAIMVAGAASVEEMTASASDPGWPDEDEDAPLSTEVTDQEGGE